jgi:hypothetical protein
MVSTSVVTRKLVKLLLMTCVVIAVISIAVQNVGRLTRFVARMMHESGSKALIADHREGLRGPDVSS